MIGMLMKELYVMKSIGRSYFLIITIFAVMTLTGLYDFAIFSGMCVMLLIMMPITGFAYDEQAGWDKYAVSTPVGRRGVVRGKYLFALLMLPLALVIMLTIYAVMGLVSPRESEAGSVLLGVLIAGLGLFLMDILLPILFKFGSQKSRVILMLVVGVSVAAIVGGGLMLFKNINDIEPLLPLLCTLFLTTALGGLVISYFTSLAIYQKKEL